MSVTKSAGADPRRIAAFALGCAMACVLVGAGAACRKAAPGVESAPQATARPAEVLDPAPAAAARADDAGVRGALPVLGTTRWRASFLRRIAVSRDGAVLVAGTGLGEVVVFDPATGARKRTVRADGEHFALSADGALVAAPAWGLGEKRVLVVDLATGEPRRRLTARAEVESLDLSADGSLVVVGEEGGGLEVFDVGTGEVRFAETTPGADVEAVRFVGDGPTLVVSGAEDGTVQVRPLADWSAMHALPHVDSSIGAIAATPDGSRIATIDDRSTVRVFDAATGALDTRFDTGSLFPSHGLALTPDGRRVVIGSHSGRLALWDVGKGREIARLVDHEISANAVAVSADGAFVWGGGHDGAIRKWAVSDGAEVALAPRGHVRPVRALAISPDGALLYAPAGDRAVVVWDLATRAEVARFGDRDDGHDDDVTTLALSPDGTRLATGGHDQKIRVWDTATRKVVRAAFGHERAVTALAWSPDGARLASGGRDGSLLVQGADLGRPLVARLDDSNGLTALAWSPAGDLLAVGDSMGIVRLIDVAHDLEVAELQEGYASDATWLGFAPDGRSFALTAGDDLVIYDTATAAVRVALSSPGTSLSRADWAPSGDALLIADDDGYVWLVDGRSGAVRAHVRRPDDNVRLVRFLPGGERLVVSLDDTTIAIWDLARDLRGRAADLRDPEEDGSYEDDDEDVGLAPPDDDGEEDVGEEDDEEHEKGGPRRLPLPPACPDAGPDRFGDPLPACAVQRLGTRRLRGGGELTEGAFSADGRLFAAGGADDELVYVWDTATGAEVLRGHNGEIGLGPLAFLPDGRLLACAAFGDRLVVWDVAVGRKAAVWEMPCKEIEVARDGKTVALRDREDRWSTWDVATGERLSAPALRPAPESPRYDEVPSGLHPAFDLTMRIVTPTGASAVHNGTAVALWDTAKKSAAKLRRVTVGAHDHFVPGPRDESFAVLRDMSADFWAWEKGAPLLRPDGHRHWVTSVAATTSKGGGDTVTTRDGTSQYTWDLATGRLLAERPAPADDPAGASIFADDNPAKERLAAAGIPYDGDALTVVERSPDGAWLVSGDLYGEVRVWSTADGSLVARLPGHRNSVTSVAFTKDGRRFVTGSWDATALVWDADAIRAATKPPAEPAVRPATD